MKGLSFSIVIKSITLIVHFMKYLFCMFHQVTSTISTESVLLEGGGASTWFPAGGCQERPEKSPCQGWPGESPCWPEESLGQGWPEESARYWGESACWPGQGVSAVGGQGWPEESAGWPVLTSLTVTVEQCNGDCWWKCGNYNPPK